MLRSLPENRASRRAVTTWLIKALPLGLAGQSCPPDAGGIPGHCCLRDVGHGALPLPQLKVPLQASEHIFLCSIQSVDAVREAAAGERVRPSAQESCFGPPFLIGGPPPRGSVEGSLSDFCPSGYPSSLLSLCHQSPRKDSSQGQVLVASPQGEIVPGSPSRGTLLSIFSQKPFEKIWKALEHCPGLQGSEVSVSLGGRILYCPPPPTYSCSSETHRRL